MQKKKKQVIFNFIIGEELQEAVDDYRRKQKKLPSRAEAVRELLWKGLEASKKPKKG